MKLTGAGANRFLAAPDKTVLAVLLYGPNASAIEERARALVSHALGADPDPLALTRLSDEDIRKDKARLGDELAAQSLLGGPRCVRLRLASAAGAESLVAAVQALDDGPPPAAFLLVEAGELPPSSAVRVAFEAAQRAAALPCYEDDAADIAALARAVLEGAAVTLAPEAEAAFLAGLPEDRGLARAEAEKVALFAYGLGRPLTREDIEALGVAASESEDDDAARAVLSGDMRVAERLLARSGGRGVSTLKALERRLLRLLEGHTLAGQGVPVREVSGRLRPPVLFLERDLYVRHLRDWPVARLTRALDQVWSAELACKRAGAPAELIAAATYRAVGGLRTSSG